MLSGGCSSARDLFSDPAPRLRAPFCTLSHPRRSGGSCPNLGESKIIKFSTQRMMMIVRTQAALVPTRRRCALLLSGLRVYCHLRRGGRATTQRRPSLERLSRYKLEKRKETALPVAYCKTHLENFFTLPDYKTRISAQRTNSTIASL